jgi:exoribonuclease II
MEKILTQYVIGNILQNSVLHTQKDFVKFAQHVSFKKVNEDAAEEMLQSHSEPLSNEDLMAHSIRNSSRRRILRNFTALT